MLKWKKCTLTKKLNIINEINVPRYVYTRAERQSTRDEEIDGDKINTLTSILRGRRRLRANSKR